MNLDVLVMFLNVCDSSSFEEDDAEEEDVEESEDEGCYATFDDEHW